MSPQNTSSNQTLIYNIINNYDNGYVNVYMGNTSNGLININGLSLNVNIHTKL